MPSYDCASGSSNIVINEIGVQDDFVELYTNAALTTSSLNLCYTYAGNNEECIRFPADGSYDAGEFIVKDVSSNFDQNAGQVMLLNASNQVLDAWAYCGTGGSVCADKAYEVTGSCEKHITSFDNGDKVVHAIPDGSGQLLVPDANKANTKGASNNGSSGNSTPATAEGFTCQHGNDGRLYTRLVNTPFTLQIKALDSNGDLETDYANDADRQVTVELVDMSGGGSCASYSVVSGSASLTSDFSASDGGQLTSGNFTVDKAYSTVGCRVTDANDSPSVVGCSIDTFSIRPQALSLQTATSVSDSASAAVLEKAGNTFTLTVAGGAGYSGTPTIDANAVLHSGATPGTIAGTFTNTDASAGTAEGTGFSYSEVGYFKFNTDGLMDSSFTASDTAGADCIVASSSNTLNVDGKLGCVIGSDQSGWIGRFTPYEFLLSNQSEGVLSNACVAGGFTYAGQSLNYLAGNNPVILIKAVNSTGNVTKNYTGDYAGLSAASVSISTVSSASITSSAGTKSFAALTGADVGQFTLELDGYSYIYDVDGNDLAAPLTPSINLQVAVSDGSEASGSATLSVDNSLVELRFGRLSVANATGAESSDLDMALQAQYYDGSGWLTNADDNCTALTIGAVSFSDPDVSDALVVSDTCVLNGSNCADAGNVISASSGAISITLKAPGSGKTGTLDLTIDVPDYLKFDWDDDGLVDDPAASVTFGSSPREQTLIFMRDVR